MYQPCVNDYLDLYLYDHGFLRILIKNYYKIDDKLSRCVQPSPSDIKKYGKSGIKTIINLRGSCPKGFNKLENFYCQKYNINKIDFKLYSRDLPSKKMINDLAKLYCNVDYPALIHCKSGADRAGLGACLYLIYHKKLPVRQAIKQLSLKFGHISFGKTGLIDYMFKRYLLHYPKEEKSFQTWINDEYDPRIIKLDYPANSFADFFTGTILRRE